MTKAVEWYTKAAENGNTDAMYNLGLCFEHADGVEQDLSKAVEWHTKAVEKGHSGARKNLSYIFNHTVRKAAENRISPRLSSGTPRRPRMGTAMPCTTSPPSSTKALCPGMAVLR